MANAQRPFLILLIWPWRISSNTCRKSSLKNVESCVPFPLWRRPTQHIQMRRLLKSPGVLYDLLTCFIFQGRMVFWLLAPCSSCSYLSLQEEKHPILKTLIRNIVWSQALSDFTLETIWHPLPLWILTCRNAKKWMSPLICIVLFFFFITRRKVPAHSFVTKVQLVDLANGIKILGHLKFAAARK